MRARKRSTPGKSPRPNTIKIVLVKWRDATHQEDDSTGPIGTMIAWTVGFLVHRTKKEIAFCMEIFEDGGKRNITTIPMPMVINIRTLASIPITTE